MDHDWNIGYALPKYKFVSNTGTHYTPGTYLYNTTKILLHIARTNLSVRSVIT